MVKPVRPNILYLVHRFPYPPDKGDRIRAFHLLKYLARHNAVHLACLADEAVTENACTALQRYCERLAIVRLGRTRWLRGLCSALQGQTITQGVFHSPILATTVRRWAQETDFQASLASASSMVSYLRMKELETVPAIVDLVDVDSQKWLDYAAAGRGPRTWLYRLEGQRLRGLERELPDWAAAVTLVGEAEADLYRSFCAAGPVHVVTNGVDLDYFQPSADRPGEGCVFVGALDYRPNVEGAQWFCREVWPEILRCRPDTKLRLVGRRPAPAVRRLGELPGVELVGQVADVRPQIAGAAVVVVPLQIARGVQNKVLEALAMGKATVASPQSLAGLGAKPGVHLMEAASTQQWVEVLLRLLDNQDLRRQLGIAGRHYVEAHHRWSGCLEPLGQLLDVHNRAPDSHEAGSPLVGSVELRGPTDGHTVHGNS
jgi:sugar transferase (PEP-CTERM/EpsH1 system associated)